MAVPPSGYRFPKEAPGDVVRGEWKEGPLPPDTWWWGGVVLNDMKFGFYYAEFHGDHATLENGKRVEADEIALYDNSLIPPENCKKNLRADERS